MFTLKVILKRPFPTEHCSTYLALPSGSVLTRFSASFVIFTFFSVSVVTGKDAERITTLRTLIRPEPIMNVHMSLERMFLHEGFGTDRTLEIILPQVHIIMLV